MKVRGIPASGGVSWSFRGGEEREDEDCGVADYGVEDYKVEDSGVEDYTHEDCGRRIFRGRGWKRTNKSTRASIAGSRPKIYRQKDEIFSLLLLPASCARSSKT